MKKFVFILFLQSIALSAICQEQSPAYKEVVALLRNKGYSISAEQYANLAQGESAVHTKTFYQGTSYMIVALSDDSDVLDVDVYLKDMNGNVYDKDTDRESIAVLTFEPSFTRSMKVEIKNYSSRTPNYKSRCRFVIGYK